MSAGRSGSRAGCREGRRAGVPTGPARGEGARTDAGEHEDDEEGAGDGDEGGGEGRKDGGDGAELRGAARVSRASGGGGRAAAPHLAEDAEDAAAAEEEEEGEGEADGGEADDGQADDEGVEEAPGVGEEGGGPVRVGVDGELGREDEDKDAVGAVQRAVVLGGVARVGEDRGDLRGVDVEPEVLRRGSGVSGGGRMVRAARRVTARMSPAERDWKRKEL